MRREEIVRFIAGRKSDFEKEFGLKRIGLFGSYARDESREGSDIDIVVELEKPDLFHLIGIKQNIEEALGLRVDIVRLRSTMNRALRSRIEQDAFYV